MDQKGQCPCEKKGNCNECKKAILKRKANILDFWNNRKYQYRPVCPEGYGVSIDIGTTTIVMYLMDFSDGCIKSVLSEMNEQQKFGLDVISRIHYCIEMKFGADELQKSIQRQLNRMIDSVLQNGQIKKNKEQITSVCVTGNTAMIHLFLGYDVKGLAQAPFQSSFRAGLCIQAKESGIDLENALLYVPNIISSFIGSDIAVGILDCGIRERETYSMLVDIGTNAEIVIGNKEKLLACSVPAGPAFEGGQIECGVAGVEGAICRVCRKDGVLHIETIGKKSPIGICGSGILDIVSLLLKEGIINECGHMEKGRYSIIKGIYITQEDIRAIQMAKASVSAGIKILLEELHVSESEVEHLYLCGGFGHFMNIESAIGVGLIPKGFQNKIICSGNTSGSGAIRILSEKCAFEQVEQIKNHTERIELASHPSFSKYYIEEMELRVHRAI